MEGELERRLRQTQRQEQDTRQKDPETETMRQEVESSSERDRHPWKSPPPRDFSRAGGQCPTERLLGSGGDREGMEERTEGEKGREGDSEMAGASTDPRGAEPPPSPRREGPEGCTAGPGRRFRGLTHCVASKASMVL